MPKQQGAETYNSLTNQINDSQIKYLFVHKIIFFFLSDGSLFMKKSVEVNLRLKKAFYFVNEMILLSLNMLLY